jgi:hypothetical protein
MNTPIPTGEKAEEYKRLYFKYVDAVTHAAAVLGIKGMDSEEFRRADAAAGELWARLRKLGGMTGKHWMG